MEERELADQLHNMAQRTVADPRVSDADLIQVLRFIARVVLVVEQAFDEVYATLIELRHLKPEDLLEPRRTELLAGLESLMMRSRYRDVEEICSRLHHLSTQYEQTIRPRLGPVSDEQRWRAVYYLLDEHESRIISMVHQRTWNLSSMLESADTHNTSSIRTTAREAANEVREALQRLWTLRNEILGLSGDAGLLELLGAGHRSEAISASTERGEQR